MGGRHGLLLAEGHKSRWFSHKRRLLCLSSSNHVYVDLIYS
jgi:hypothetical protein